MTAALVRKGRSHEHRTGGSSRKPYCSLCLRRAFGPQHKVDQVAVLRALSTYMATPMMSLAERRAAALEGRSRGYSSREIAIRFLRQGDDFTPTEEQIVHTERSICRYIGDYKRVARVHHPELYPVRQRESRS